MKMSSDKLVEDAAGILNKSLKVMNEKPIIPYGDGLQVAQTYALLALCLRLDELTNMLKEKRR
jgi:hypothetical protein